MTFSDKLDLLMSAAGASNSALALYLRLDPSYISRMRHGSRTLPKNSEYIPDICSFLLRKASGSNKRNLLLQTVEADSSMGDEAVLQRMHEWLFEENKSPVADLISNVSKARPAAVKESGKSDAPEITTFYDHRGKLQAMISLLHLALKTDKRFDLFLYSDESTDWLESDPELTAEWNVLLRQLILRGGKIKVIHKVNQNIDEMFMVINHWMPFYMTGAVDPYYYPRLRDGVYKRTLAVVPGIGAAFSTAIGSQEMQSPTFLSTQKQMTDAFQNEFASYLMLCRPLMEFYELGSERFLKIINECLDVDSDCMLLSPNISLTTVPLSVNKKIGEKTDKETNARLTIFCEQFIYMLTNDKIPHDTTHIISLAEPNDVLAGKVPVSCSSLLCSEASYYTPEEYIEHLELILEILEADNRFKISLNNAPPVGYTIQVFENNGVYFFKEDEPHLIFRITESSTTAAFWNYLQQINEACSTSEAKNIRQIKTLIKNIKKQTNKKI